MGAVPHAQEVVEAVAQAIVAENAMVHVAVLVVMVAQEVAQVVTFSLSTDERE